MGAPYAERSPGVLMICDVSGFTALGERLASRGSEGAEVLWRLVNNYFGQMLDIIQRHGGDVLRFAGDAPIVYWPATRNNLPIVLGRVCAVARALQAEIGAYDSGEDAVLRMRVAVAASDLVTATLGGERSRLEPFVGGTAFVHLSAALADAAVGDCVVDGDSWVHALPGIEGRQTEAGNWRLTAAPSVAPTPLSGETAEHSLQPFVSRGVVQRVQAGLGAWMGELRTVTTLFLGVEGLDYDDDAVATRLDGLLRSIQRCVYQYDGSVDQFLMDDKGTVLLAAWGLPSHSHENNTERAARCGLDLLQALKEHQLTGRVGISTGRVFCGVKGNDQRREYGMLGASVNLAARLMQVASGTVICDAVTARSGGGKIEFERLPEVHVKGREGVVEVFRPRLGTGHLVDASEAQVGRVAEVSALRGHLDALGEGIGALLLIEGEAGIGKSRLVGGFLDDAAERGVRVFLGASDSIENQTPFYSFIGVFASVFGFADHLGVAQRKAAAEAWFHSHPEYQELAALFNPVLRLDLADTEPTAVMEGDARGHTTLQVYLSVLQEFSPFALVFEDLHWMDSASAELLLLLLREAPESLVIVTTRPPESPPSARYTRLLNLGERWVLEPLAAAEVSTLVCRCLGVGSLPASVVNLLRERAEGHPFYSVELAYALRDRGLIHVQDDGVFVTKKGGDLTQVELPSTLEGLIASRLDTLTPTQQLCLKTASVIGRVFPAQMLADIYPLEVDADTLTPELEVVRNRDITVLETPKPDLAYLFKHVITQEVAYEQLLFEQRRELHRAAAEWYEAGNAGDVAPLYPLLAHHWQQADVRDRAIDNLEAAGEQAHRSFANRETYNFIASALELDESDGPPSSDVRRARWHRILGVAAGRLGELHRSREHLALAAKHLGYALPRTKFGLGFSFVWESVRQVWRRYMGPPTGAVAQRAQRLEAANVYAELGLMGYFAGDILMLLYGSLRGLNLAEDCGPSPDLARMKAGMAIVVASIPMHGAAESYSLEALDTADRFDDQYARANARHYRGAFLCGLGEWDQAGSNFGESLVGYTKVGDGRRASEARNCLVQARMNQGRYPEASEHIEALGHLARVRDDRQVLFWVKTAQLELLWRRRDVAAAVAHLQNVHELDDTDEEIYIHRAQGLRVHIRVMQGDLDAANTAAQVLLPAQRAASFIEIWQVTCLADLYLAQWECGDSTARKRAIKAVKGVHGFAGVFPLGKPYAHYYEGRRWAMDGKSPKAIICFELAIREARAFNMPWEQMLAHEALAQIVQGADQQHHQMEAARLKEKLASTGLSEGPPVEALSAV